jgi:tetratricopeptide (TPR) repeat protein
MMWNVQFTLNQQFQQGCFFGQQAMMAEQMGNLPGAAQGYDQAIALIGSSMTLAMQSGVPVPDNVLFIFSFSHFNAARVKHLAGWPQFASMHLSQAHQALNQAIAINPGFFQYHSAAGVLQLAEGNVAGAMASFQRAIQLNPMDSWSQWMLASLYSMQGNAVASNQVYHSAVGIQPNLPPPQQFVQQFQPPAGRAGSEGSGKSAKHDWFELINNALKFGNTVAGLFDQGGGGQAQPDWNSTGWNF